MIFLIDKAFMVKRKAFKESRYYTKNVKRQEQQHASFKSVTYYTPIEGNIV